MLGTKILAAVAAVSQGSQWAITAHGEVFIQPYGWTIHATSGSIIISCVMCALLAAAMHPPVVPDSPNMADEDTGE